LPEPFAKLADAQITIMVYEVAKFLSWENLTHRDDLSAEMKTMIDAGLAISAQQYDAARSLARTCRDRLPQVFSDFDVLVAPSTAGEAPLGVEATGDPLFNRIWTLLGVPVVHVPAAFGPRGLPLGVTVVGPFGRDRATLVAAEWIHTRLGGFEGDER
jgi:Asp-tRNA(Asn)/Glu-tRNA(Gln) amidotransferase A subunit family amidase